MLRTARTPALALALWIGATALLGACSTTQASASDDAPASASGDADFAQLTEGLERRAGLLTTWFDTEKHRVLIELPAPTEDGVCARLIALASLRRGLGSNDVGLDRGLLGSEQIIELRRLGERVLVEVPNSRYFVASDEPAQRMAANDSFARSVLFGAKALAVHQDGRALVDLGPWLLSDLMNVSAALRDAGQGSFQLQAERSAVEFADCHVFPRNLELEATLGFRGDAPGGEVRATTPEAGAPSLVQHLSLFALPRAGYEPQPHDPRAGAFAVTRTRLDAPLGAPLVERFAARHRLSRRDDGTPEPLVYYVDRGAPEPVRSALLDGARWWEEAFAAAGWPDTYRVELLPEGVHPLDSRYHLIQWAHRRTRGWSYGASISDPRTGEILRGQVTLGALRVRQDILLFEGLLGATKSGSGAADDPVELALARLRQLSAHEVGHTLGLAHNFAASTYGDRESVMDYPAPRVLLADDGGLDLSEAYGVGIGSWDRFAIRHLYAEAPADQALQAARDSWVDQARNGGLVYLSDADARPGGSSDARAALWDDGADPLAGLELALEVRRRALADFGADRVDPVRPRAHLQEVLVPVVLHHRYAVDRAAKLVGGREVDHVRAGDDAELLRPVPAETQRAAVELLLSALDTEALELPTEVLGLLSPRPPSERPHRELFDTLTAPQVDPELIAATQARMVFGALLRPERLNRLAQEHARDASWPSVDELLQTTSRHAWEQATDLDASAARRTLGRVVLQQYTRRLQELSESAACSQTTRAVAEHALRALVPQLGSAATQLADTRADERASLFALGTQLTRFLERERADATPTPPSGRTPPGSPIGVLDSHADCGFELD